MKKKLLIIASAIISSLSVLIFFKKFKKKNFSLNLARGFCTKKITGANFHSHERFFRENPLAIILLIVFVTVLLFNGGLQNYLQFFQTSTIQVKYQTEPFNGTVNPIDKVPKWTMLTDAERNYNYSQIPKHKFMSLPPYNVRDFQKGLTWSKHNERERNAYITYPVPNLGNYKLDGTENSGSHTGLDIKAPTGTPVRVISRGVVIKAETGKTGYGNHVVVMHQEVPNLQNPAKKETIFSAYAHLSTIAVRTGQQVQKGQIIGKVGSSGMATTPHLHFQIDTADAPFHPYWPLSWSDVKNHGLNSFFEAVKRGVNSNLARKYTIHPMKLVAKNIGYVPTKSSKLVAEAGTIPQKTKSSRDLTPSKKESKAVSTKPQKVKSNKKLLIADRRYRHQREIVPRQNNHIRAGTRRPNRATNQLHASAKKSSKTASISEKVGKDVNLNHTDNNNFYFEYSRNFSPRTPKTIKLFIKDHSLIPNSGVIINSSADELVKVVPTVARAEAFEKGFLEVKIFANTERPFKVFATGKGIKVETKSFLAQPFKDVNSVGEERFAAQYVKDRKIMKGYTDGSFRPNQTLNRAEAVKVIVEANEIPLTKSENKFRDVSPSAWFYPYVNTAVANEIVRGYAGNWFKPANEVSLAEFLKMASEAKKVSLQDGKTKPYVDVPADSWYEKYFSFARKKGLIKPNSQGQVQPNKKISRIEVAIILYKLSNLR